MKEQRGEAPEDTPPKPEDVFVDELGLSVSTSHLLFKGGVSSVEELTARTPKDLSEIRDFGLGRLRKVQEELEEHGLSLEAEDTSIDELGFDLKTRRILVRCGVSTVGDLTSKTPGDFRRVRGFGPVRIKMIQERLEERGLSLAEGEATPLKPYKPRI